MNQNRSFLSVFIMLIFLASLGCQQLSGQKISSEAPPEAELSKYVESFDRYNVPAQQIAPEESTRGVSRTVRHNQPLFKKGQAIFKTDCTACHRITSTLGFRIDSEHWERTIKRLKQISNKPLTRPEIYELVDIHVSQQQEEVAAFKNTCVRCHDDRRINQRSMTQEQWVETIKRMLQKAPELFSDDRISLLTAYFHRRELALVKTFSGSCLNCHFDNIRDSTLYGFGQRLPVADKELVALHAERQRKEIQIYESRCFKCHPDRGREKDKTDTENLIVRSRNEWLEFIAKLQGVTLNDASRGKISHQIEYHMQKRLFEKK